MMEAPTTLPPTTMPPNADAPGETAQHRTALQVELFAPGARALTQARETRPKNTNLSYDPKQKEWRDFCAEKGFEDGELVYENKVIWFLNELLLGREIRSSRYYKRRNRTPPDGGDPIRQTLGMSAIRSYVAAIVDLWSLQKSQGINPHPTPRGSPQWPVKGAFARRAKTTPARICGQGRGHPAGRLRRSQDDWGDPVLLAGPDNTEAADGGVLPAHCCRLPSGS
jgi:hypothetical protein